MSPLYSHLMQIYETKNTFSEVTSKHEIEQSIYIFDVILILTYIKAKLQN